ncbi:MAG: exodeoxyribonuclease VII large subunit [Planctomycetota bacterium]|nr:MAG: exodeoxyribonuclease VII large subunit [Planctomycetota bacterium]
MKNRAGNLKLFQTLKDEIDHRKESPSSKREDKAISVSELTDSIKYNLERSFKSVWVEGEVSNVSKPFSGHIYATLKDKGAQISIVIFKSNASRIKFDFKDGLELVVRGHVTVYNQRGNYQIICQSVEPKGIGSLKLAFDQLKIKLKDEGLFDEGLKKELPFLPTTIGLVTSLTGAAVKDFITAIKDRCPIVNVKLIPVKVQGEGSAIGIASAIGKLNHLNDVDVIVIGRGGGSMEDLWAFNEEIVARAIHHSDIPIVSAVGHEIDVSISDYVADEKAMTPTHAATLCVPDLSELKSNLSSLQNHLHQMVEAEIESVQSAIKGYKRFFSHENIIRRFEKYIIHVDHLGSRLKKASFDNFNKADQEVSRLKVKLKLASTELQFHLKHSDTELRNNMQKLKKIVETSISDNRKQLGLFGKELELLSPLKTIDRGYSITKNPEGNLISSINNIEEGQQVETILKDGSIISKVSSVRSKDEN